MAWNLQAWRESGGHSAVGTCVCGGKGHASQDRQPYLGAGKRGLWLRIPPYSTPRARLRRRIDEGDFPRYRGETSHDGIVKASLASRIKATS
jgi:hypothetical protein